MPSATWPSDETVLEETRAWLTQIVIGLELCPFAKPVHQKGLIRYVVSSAETPEALLEAVLEESRRLSETDPALIDTTLLIHPRVLSDFLDYNDFLTIVELALEDLNLTGELQVASFHPDYLYAGNTPDDPANYVTRSPYPMLHFLREVSVDRAVAVFPDASVIVQKNVITLRTLGLAACAHLLAGVRRSEP